MQTKTIVVFIIVLTNATVAFTQTKYDVQWRGFTLKRSDSPITKDNLLTLNIDFENRLRDLDTIRYLRLDPTFSSPSRKPESGYIISGEIIYHMSDEYSIFTTLTEPNGIQTNLPSTPMVHVDFNTLRILVRSHAENVYKWFEDNMYISNSGDIQPLLIDFDNEYMQKLSSIDIEEANRALQRLAIMESKFGTSEAIRVEIFNSRRNAIISGATAVPLSKAEESIARVFDWRISNDTSTSFCKEAETYALLIKPIIEQSGDPQLLARLEKVESKIKEYWEQAYFAIYSGGLELFFEKPILMLPDSSGFNVRKAYPGILGFNLRYNGPASLPLQWYAHLSYAGINGNIKENEVAYLDDAAIHYFSLSTGMNLQFYVNRIVAPYGYFGLGYVHLFEHASDGQDSITLNFPGMIMDVGAGSRFHINQHFALNAMVQWNMMLTQTMIMDVKISLGVSYMFFGKEYITRR